jgi:hypothetical protein
LRFLWPVCAFSGLFGQASLRVCAFSDIVCFFRLLRLFKALCAFQAYWRMFALFHGLFYACLHSFGSFVIFQVPNRTKSECVSFSFRILSAMSSKCLPCCGNSMCWTSWRRFVTKSLM